MPRRVRVNQIHYSQPAQLVNRFSCMVVVIILHIRVVQGAQQPQQLIF